ncbi:hypothetical protein EVG20_g10087 [Dentipellis fragilis]|uniref:CCHC-type domain-containing protein n=1 Tax=Dentipellis fragilis TaxID=205917 RepID=A0A4Y9XTP9_9AGAM|nr:hypothetical protein EVG20_g10087 [Dentipellis fragilis]
MSSELRPDPDDPCRQIDPLPFSIEREPGNPDFSEYSFLQDISRYPYLTLSDLDEAAQEYKHWHPTTPRSAPTSAPEQSPEQLQSEPLGVPDGVVYNSTTKKYYAWKAGARGDFVRAIVGWRPRLSAIGDDWFWQTGGLFLTPNDFSLSLQEQERLTEVQRLRLESLRPAPQAVITPLPDSPPRPPPQPLPLANLSLVSSIPTMSSPSNSVPTTTNEIGVKPEPSTRPSTWATQRGNEILTDDDTNEALAAKNDPLITLITPCFNTFSKLLECFKVDFKPLDDSAEACAGIENLRMGYDKVALVHFFKKGLNGALLEKSMMTYPMPKDLDEWKAWARDCNAQWLEVQCEQKARAPRGGSVQPRNMSAPMRNTPNRMTPSVTPQSEQCLPTLAKLSDQECQRLSKEGACFRCRQKDHMSFECPLNQGPRVGAIEADTSPGRTPTPQNPAPMSSLATPPRVFAVATLASTLRALGAEEREEARAALKDLVECENF